MMSADLIADLRIIAEAHGRTMSDLAEVCFAVAADDNDDDQEES